MLKKMNGKPNSKKSLSHVKKRAIHINKLHKKGVFKKEARKKRKRTRKVEARRTYRDHLEVLKKENVQKEEEPDYEITGEDMIEMLDEDDLNQLMEKYTKPKKERKKKIEDIEREGRTFNEYGEVDKQMKDMTLKEFLPIMTEKGWTVKSDVIPDKLKELLLSRYKRVEKKKGEEEEEEKEDKDSGISDEEEEGEIVLPEKVEKPKLKSVAQILAERQRSILEKKVQMGCLATNLVQDPSKTSNLRRLLDMMKDSDPGMEVTIGKYASLTLLQVFHDLIPGYRVQENMLENTMKKDTLSTARQEIEFLSSYSRYLKTLEDNLELLKDDPTNLGLITLSETSLHCLGDLLVLHPHFNYTVNIIQALIPYLNNNHKKFRHLAYEALAQTIRNDKSCYLSLEIVRKVYRLTHRLRFKVKNEVFQLFLALRSGEMKNSDCVTEDHNKTDKALSHKQKMIKKLNEQAQKKPSRKQKKDKKKMAKIRDQMAEINTQEIHNVQNVRHSEILKSVFGLYFHVLKNKPQSKKITVVLEGLAKFSHLINIDFFSDLLALMNQFLEDGILGKRESLHCIQTVFTILSGQGESLNMDPLRFYNKFYGILGTFSRKDLENNLETILKINDQMLIMRRKKVSPAIVLSFAKRLATVSLTLPHQAAIPTLVSLKKILTTFSVSEALLDTDPEGSPGMFTPEILDPEHANSVSTALFEMSLAQKHYHPTVRMMSTNILSNIPARKIPAIHNVTRRSTAELLSDFGHQQFKFNPSITRPEVHITAKKRKPLRQVFVGDSLENLKLQIMRERVMDEGQNDESDVQEPRKKRSKRGICPVTEKDAFCIESSIYRKVEDFTSPFVELQ